MLGLSHAGVAIVAAQVAEMPHIGEKWYWQVAGLPGESGTNQLRTK
jgi:hypothetical protein